MRYDSYRYLWPCRAERKIAPTDLAFFEQRGWYGQAKMNGDCVCLYVSAVEAKTGLRDTFQRYRHGDKPLSGWSPGDAWGDFVDHLPGRGWYVFEAELLNDSAAGARDTLYLHDLLVDDGNYLVGVSYRARYLALHGLLEDYSGRSCAADINVSVYAPKLWLANNHRHDFRAWLDAPNMPIGFEGLVFKNPDAPLALCARQTANSGWQVKCRRPGANKSF